MSVSKLNSEENEEATREILVLDKDNNWTIYGVTEKLTNHVIEMVEAIQGKEPQEEAFLPREKLEWLKKIWVSDNDSDEALLFSYYRFVAPTYGFLWKEDRERSFKELIIKKFWGKNFLKGKKLIGDIARKVQNMHGFEIARKSIAFTDEWKKEWLEKIGVNNNDENKNRTVYSNLYNKFIKENFMFYLVNWFGPERILQWWNLLDELNIKYIEQK